MSAAPFYGAADGRIDPVLQPTDHPNSAFSAGVGTPHILTDPETRDTKLMFTGWETSDGSSRSLFVGDIDEALNVSNISEILSPSYFGGGATVAAGYPLWDATNEEWLVGMTNVADGITFVRFTRDFSTKIGYQTWDFSTKDSGATPWIRSDGALFAVTTANDNFDIAAYKIQSDYSTRPLSGTTGVNSLLIEGDNIYAHPDVHTVVPTHRGLAILFESNKGSTHGAEWRCSIAFTEENGNGMKRAMPSARPLVNIDQAGNHTSIGHPNYSTSLGRPMMLFSRFKNVETGSFDHEIWAQEVDRAFLDPQSWFPYKKRVLTSKTVSQPYPTFEASKLLIDIDATASGTFTLREASRYSGSSDYSTRTASVSTGANRVVFDDPLSFVQADPDFSLNSIDLILKR